MSPFAGWLTVRGAWFRLRRAGWRARNGWFGLVCGGENVENFPEVAADLFLAGGRLANLVLLNPLARGTHLTTYTQATGLVQGAGDCAGGRGIVLAQLTAGLSHFLQDAVQQSGEFELTAGDGFQIGDVLRREVPQFLGQGAAAQLRRSPRRILLVAKQLADLVGDSAIAVPPGKLADHPFD